MNAREMLRKIAGDHDTIANVTSYDRFRAESQLGKDFAERCPGGYTSEGQAAWFDERMSEVKGDYVRVVVWIAFVTALLCYGDRGNPAIVSAKARVEAYKAGPWSGWENCRDDRTIRFHHRDGSHVDYDTVTEKVLDG